MARSFCNRRGLSLSILNNRVLGLRKNLMNQYLQHTKSKGYMGLLFRAHQIALTKSNLPLLLHLPSEL
jgi:hypothetical protein